jgi:hypothetical protein
MEAHMNEVFYRSPLILPYNREKAVAYAHQWAYGRNPVYYNFERIGGDCTNFASQVLLAGSGIMNFSPVYGWNYININNRTASWTGVNFLYNFLLNNKGNGPFAEEVDEKDVKPGDIIQLAFQKESFFNHSPVVVKTGMPVSLSNIQIATHTDDQDNYSILNYNWIKIRFIHILGVRKM